MWTRKDLKANGKRAFLRNYWNCVVVCIIAAMLGGGASGASGSSGSSSLSDLFDTSGQGTSTSLEAIPQVSTGVIAIVLVVALIVAALAVCLSILLGNVVAVGHARFFLENREHETSVSTLFHGFREGRYGKNVLVMFLEGLYIFGWSLLLVIPGIVKGYEYRLVPYLLAENPEIDRKRLFQLSSQMMRGHKWESFVIELSFFGWNLLSILTLGILQVFFVRPYTEATFAEFYTALKAEAKHMGITDDQELPGVVEVIPTGYAEDMVHEACYNEVLEPVPEEESEETAE